MSIIVSNKDQLDQAFENALHYHQLTQEARNEMRQFLEVAYRLGHLELEVARIISHPAPPLMDNVKDDPAIHPHEYAQGYGQDRAAAATLQMISESEEERDRQTATLQRDLEANNVEGLKKHLEAISKEIDPCSVIAAPGQKG